MATKTGYRPFTRKAGSGPGNWKALLSSRFQTQTCLSYGSGRSAPDDQLGADLPCAVLPRGARQRGGWPCCIGPTCCLTNLRDRGLRIVVRLFILAHEPVETLMRSPEPSQSPARPAAAVKRSAASPTEENCVEQDHEVRALSSASAIVCVISDMDSRVDRTCRGGKREPSHNHTSILRYIRAGFSNYWLVVGRSKRRIFA